MRSRERADYYVTSAYPGYKPWYKKALTTMQITQFVVDLFIVYFACASTLHSSYVSGGD